jgi:hypothetical protein
MQIQGQVGPQQVVAGDTPNIAQGKGAEILVSEYQGKYYTLAYAGRVFMTCNQTVATLSTLSTTYTGLLVANPIGSGVNAILLQCAVALASAPAGISTVGHQASVTIQKTNITNGTANTIYNGVLGGPAATVCVASVAATLPTAPVQVRSLGVGVTATGAAAPIAFALDDIAGSLILPPGTYCGLGYVTTAPAVIASYHWCELPQ